MGFQNAVALLIGVTLFSSCAQFAEDVRPREFLFREKAPLPQAFYSEDYIVYRLRSGETPETLAELFLGHKRKSWIIREANRGTLFEEGQLVVIPLKDENNGGLHPDGYQAVPILCYHRFADRCGASLCMPSDLFEKQMAYLKENGYNVIPMADLFDFLIYRRPIPQKAVVITMDDGYNSAYEIAFPILKKYGFRATLFIYTDFIGMTKSAITWDQLRSMKEEGFEIGSHSLSHCDLTKKGEIETEEDYFDRVTRELFLSKKILDQRLNQNTVYLAFPYGEHNQRLLSLCEKAGYKLAFTVDHGGNPFFSYPLSLRRDQIFKKDMDHFVAKLKTFYEFPIR